MIKLFTYKNTKYSTFEQQCGLNPPPPFKYHLNFNCTPVLSDCDTPFRFITGNRTILLCSKKGGWGLLMFPFEEWGGRWNVIQRYGNENLLKSSKGGRQRMLIFLRVDWILKPYHTANITFKWWIMEYVEGSHITASFFVPSDTTRLCLTVLNPVLESLNSFPIHEKRFFINPSSRFSFPSFFFFFSFL